MGIRVDDGYGDGARGAEAGEKFTPVKAGDDLRQVARTILVENLDGNSE
jgi:hypothetical protein